MENLGQPEDSASCHIAYDEIHRLKRTILIFFVVGLLLMDVAICLLAIGWTHPVTIIIGQAMLALGAAAFITVIVLNHRKNVRSCFARRKNLPFPSTEPRS